MKRRYGAGWLTGKRLIASGIRQKIRGKYLALPIFRENERGVKIILYRGGNVTAFPPLCITREIPFDDKIAQFIRRTNGSVIKQFDYVVFMTDGNNGIFMNIQNTREIYSGHLSVLPGDTKTPYGRFNDLW